MFFIVVLPFGANLECVDQEVRRILRIWLCTFGVKLQRRNSNSRTAQGGIDLLGHLASRSINRERTLTGNPHRTVSSNLSGVRPEKSQRVTVAKQGCPGIESVWVKYHRNLS